MSSYPPPPKAPEPYGQPYGGQPAGEPPLFLPYYGISFTGAIRRFFKKYATFSGRASRSEFWWWYLASIIVGIILNILSSATGGGMGGRMTAGSSVVQIISGLWSLATIVPGLAIIWRRLHDTNRSGAWFFLIFIPLVGIIILIVWWASASKPEGQRFDTPGVQYDPPAPQY